MKSWCVGAEPVLAWYDENAKVPFYSLWNGKQLVGSWNEDNQAAARDNLEKNLKLFEDNNISEVFTLKLHPQADKSGFVTDKTPVYYSLNFRPSEFSLNPQMSGTPGQMVFQNNPGMQTMLEEIRAMRSEINAIKAESEFDTDNDPPGIGGLFDKLMQIPGVEQQVAPYIGGILQKIFPGVAPAAPVPGIYPFPGNQVGAIAGLPSEQEEKIDQAIDILEKHDPQLGDDLLKLAAIAQRDPAQFNVLLSVLRNG
jgi:hypothetical protein